MEEWKKIKGERSRGEEREGRKESGEEKNE